MSTQVELATFGAGCFWSVEARYQAAEGVIKATSGYMGGKPQPSYEAVCTGMSGHAEVVQVQFDAGQIGYETLLGMFFDMHNPTTLNRQGPDIGSQYRSVVFYHSAKQQKAAGQAIEEINQSNRWVEPLVTEVLQAVTFWPAEEYHQRYLEKHGLGFCSL